MKLLQKKAKQKSRPQVNDVLFRAKDKIVLLQKRFFLIKINVDELKRFFQKHLALVRYLALSVVVILFVFLTFNTKADVAKFYPTSCLGNWDNPKYAEGTPEVKDNASHDEFSALNSAVLLRNSSSERSLN